jgi:hypothetical protein
MARVIHLRQDASDDYMLACGRFIAGNFLIDHEAGRQSAIAMRERIAREAEEERRARQKRMESYRRPSGTALTSLLGLVAAVAPVAPPQVDDWKPVPWRCCTICRQQHLGGLHRTPNGDRCTNVAE